MNLLKHFKWDIPFTVVCLIIAFLYGGVAVLPTVLMLAALEIVFSFDNAAVNARYLSRLNPFWRKMFLSVGVLIAVFGMRLLFPFAIVSIAGGVSLPDAVTLALKNGDPNTPGTFGYIIHESHTTIIPFAAMFLLLLALNFFLDNDRDEPWLSWFEKPMIRAGHFDSLSILISLGVLFFSMNFFVTEEHRNTVLFSGVIGLITYLAVNGLVTFMEAKQEERDAAIEAEEGSLGHVLLLSGKHAFTMFLFLEVLDASFSFDGVLGAFSISNSPIVICLGLAIGAMAVRSLTIYLVDEGALENFRFMEAGAHWAILILSIMLFVTLKFEVPDWGIGLSGLFVIMLSIISSHRANKREEAAVEAYDGVSGVHDSRF